MKDILVWCLSGDPRIYRTTDICDSCLGTPGLGTPCLGTPGLGTPGLGTPSLENPGLGTPSLGIPGLGTPDLGPVWSLSGNPWSGNPQTRELVSTEPQTSATVVWPVLETPGLKTLSLPGTVTLNHVKIVMKIIKDPQGIPA